MRSLLLGCLFLNGVFFGCGGIYILKTTPPEATPLERSEGWITLIIGVVCIGITATSLLVFARMARKQKREKDKS